MLKPSMALLVTVLGLAACGGGGGDSSGGPVAPGPSPTVSTSPTPSPTPAGPSLSSLIGNAEAEHAQRFLNRATFGAKPSEIVALRGGDYAAWLDAQIATPTTVQLPIVEARMRVTGLNPNDKSNDEDAYFKDLHRSDVWWEVAMNGDDQLRQRVAYALSQIFVISNVSDVLFHDVRGITHYHDMLAEHAFGNFRSLLEAVTLNPMMGEYLSMIRNERADPARNIRPDENYARELMQLFSIGLVMLNPDGSTQLDEGGQAIPTYDQDVIKAFARVFTGWMYGNAPRWHWYEWLTSSETLAMKAFPEYHDADVKVLLRGEMMPAGLSPEDALDFALDNVFAHPNVGPFIGQQLIQRLVTSNPSPEYVTRVSAVFDDNGQGVRGDLAAVIRAILLDEEALAGTSGNPNFGKLKEPMLKVARVWRAFDVEGVQTRSDNGALNPTVIRFYGSGRELGQRPYGSPSVFNFYRPDYAQPGPIRDEGLQSPEFQIINESTITSGANRLFLAAFASDKQDNTSRIFPDYWDAGNVLLDLDTLLELSGDPAALLDYLDLLLMGGAMSDGLREAVTQYLDTLVPADDFRSLRVYEALHFVLTAPEFAVLH